MNDAKFKLLTIYSRLPNVHCKGLCHEACGPIHATSIELANMQAMRPLPAKMIKNPGPMTNANSEHTHLIIDAREQICPHLDRTTKRCQVYAARPLICRAYGAAEGLVCGHGCEVEGKPITREEFLSHVRSIEALDQPSIDLPKPKPKR